MPARFLERIQGVDWGALRKTLDDQGYAKLPAILTPEDCEELIGTYASEELFRSTISMARYRFGSGEYKYYDRPLPAAVQQLREYLYPELSRTANRWHEQLGMDAGYPASLDEFLEECHRQGQLRPTPLILKYEAGGYNCLHQDLYGEAYFPFQVVFALNQRQQDYTGGEFLLVEQRPRAQSRGHVVTLEQGEGLIFPTNYRPVQGTKGYYRTTLRHGVSTVQTGIRYTLGVIFHDAT
ncbi:2OG-Fe(II) oxygenase [Paenibacillus cellulositrophicus]|uniref:2OG-Fe(II) oxygenase n=1 Tax=Paenibacillus cellulositrophicus TaxID=562959 RepID=UPI002040CA28|nr:2OG-Fe(II) oxygenase [Paenibacillus cellulositrophicus]MCM2998462.1 2OG-Fe(II) oxygenase [Paenibacillus cellulositrophicus]